MDNDLVTIFENKGKIVWWLPKDFAGTSGEIRINPGERKEFLNENNGSIYARYEKVELLVERDENGDLRHRVVTHRRSGWCPPEHNGLSLIVQNDIGNPASRYMYREGDFTIVSPAGIEIELYNLDPRLSVARYKRLVYTSEAEERLFDPRVADGYRVAVKREEFQRILRDEAELRKLEELRVAVYAHSVRELQDIEVRRVRKKG
jgi:hypothetical protein